MLTEVRPDGIIYSETTIQVIMLELPIPWEENIDEAHEGKIGKYLLIVKESKKRVWRAQCKQIEIRC